MDVKQFRDYIVKPTLDALEEYLPNCNSEESIDLMMGTAAQESNFKYVRQIGGGPAASFFQIEPDTFRDHFFSFIDHRDHLCDFLCEQYLPESLSSGTGSIGQLEAYVDHLDDHQLQYLLSSNIGLSVVIARIKYWRFAEPLPKKDDPDYIVKLGQYWKDHYNTKKGKGTVDEFVANYHRYLK